ncbi:hypothetical protein [Brucella thiophenivorans]|uniref:DUF1496 domain-containing protein n=1 Tax=Brucella thiophenivorans TaxID=571255 RepID=A0A256FTP9_9HYPH|nr:hypothetical protein [Brucella thiophenivorans]OYR18237.1 hypothetical protein CEV31_4249 [Brucella thiophenivorans]
MFPFSHALRLNLAVSAIAVAFSFFTQPSYAQNSSKTCVIDLATIAENEAVIVSQQGCFVVDAKAHKRELITITSTYIRRIDQPEKGE